MWLTPGWGLMAAAAPSRCSGATLRATRAEESLKGELQHLAKAESYLNPTMRKRLAELRVWHARYVILPEMRK